MEIEEKPNVNAEIHLLELPLESQKDSQHTLSNTSQDNISSCSQTSTVLKNCRVSINVPKHCSRDNILQRIKSEDELPDVHDSVCKAEFHDRFSHVVS